MARKPAVFGGLAVLSLLAVAAAVIARPWEAGLLALILFAIWVVAAAIWLDRRDARREAVRLANQDHRPAPSLPEEAEAFLAALDGQLGLPGDLRAEVRAELSAHFEDSIAAIEAEGNDRDLAAREAVARMGRPDELARELRRAHQTNRRLLAGAAGGVFQAGIGVVWGYFLGLFLILIGAIVLAVLLNTVLKPPVDFLAGHVQLEIDQSALAIGSVFGALVGLLAAFIAARRAVQECSRASRRTVRQVGPLWAIAGFLAIGYLVMFRVTAQQSWIAVALELLIPVAFAAGALVKTEARFPIATGRAFAAVVLVIVLTLPLVLLAGLTVSGSGGQSWSTDNVKEDLVFDRIAPAWPTQGPPLVNSQGTAMGVPIIDDVWEVQDGPQLARFGDLRIELWRAERFAGTPDWVDDFVPASGYATPFATVPAVIDSNRMAVRFDLSHVRSTAWVILLTGVAPGGQRYRLGYSGPITTAFSGTVWDWLTASQ